jgi:hypothetical protein
MRRSLHPGVGMRRHWLFLLVLLGACVTEVDGDADHEPFDFEVEDGGKADGVSATFNMNNVLTDELFTDVDAMGVAELQTFFEDSPYNNRSWLADHTIDGVSAAQAVVDAARAHGIHPLVLVARMQTESSLVSKSVRPTQRLIDRALGCGCPDGGTCSTLFKGLAKQLQCGAETMRKWYDRSIDGTGQWRKDVSRKTLDPRTVTPANHATASLYAYTPWVLVGRGGTWLAWNVTRKYVSFAEREGLVTPPLPEE